MIRVKVTNGVFPGSVSASCLRVSKSRSRPHASMFGTTRSAESREYHLFMSGGWMVSPFQGIPNMPLQLDSMMNSCIPASRADGGMIYSTRRSDPKPPVMPVEGVRSNPNGGEHRQTLKRSTVNTINHRLASWVKFNCQNIICQPQDALLERKPSDIEHGRIVAKNSVL